MAYEKQNFEPGQVLKAEHLNHMEEGIFELGTQMVTAVENAVESEKGNIVDMLITELQGLPVFGVVDENNIIKVTSQLSDGEYVLKYENADGTFSEIGTITIGNGDSGEDEPTVGYTNWIPKSVNADGSEYVGTNGEDGYKVGYRVNSSGTEVAQEGMCCTGFIPCTTGQTIRLKNVTVTGTKTSYLVEYYADKSYHQVQPLETFLQDDGTGVLTGTVGSDVRFIRITCGVIDETSIVTINEEIKESTASYTNLADTTLATDATLTPNSKGWMENVRINSSKAIVTADGCDITNNIVLTEGHTLRVKGIDFTTGYGRVYHYSDGDYKTSSITNAEGFSPYCTSITANGLEADTTILLECVKANVGSNNASGVLSVRFGGTLTGTKEDVIITLDEEIV